MTTRQQGALGEQAVAAYLTAKGYRILRRNYCIRGGEIDIIAENGEYIAFVEVKARRPGSMVSGFEAVTPVKQKRLLRTAQAYLYQYPSGLQPRFDIAAVTLRGGQVLDLDYLENAFDATDQPTDSF